MPTYSPLDRPAQFLKGVGPRRSEGLAKLGLLTARDVLYHVPRRYEDASTVQPIRSLEPGMEATVIGRIVSKGVLPTRKGLRIFQAVIRDRSGLIECSWPGQPFLDRAFREGDLLLVSGPVRFFHGRQIQPREHVVLARAGEAGGRAYGQGLPRLPRHGRTSAVADSKAPRRQPRRSSDRSRRIRFATGRTSGAAGVARSGGRLPLAASP